MIKITDTARDVIAEVTKELPGRYPRVIIHGVGWGGPQLGLALDGPRENEQTIKIDGVEILVNDDALPYATGSVIDYAGSPEGNGFTISSESGKCC